MSAEQNLMCLDKYVSNENQVESVNPLQTPMNILNNEC